MLIVRTLSPGSARYFFDGRDPGRWQGGATRLLGLHGPPSRAEIERVLDGCDPRTGGYLPERRPARRRSGWDLIFSAPKSLSLLHSAVAPPDGTDVAQAHRDAVDDVVGHLDRAVTSRRRSGGQPTPAEGLVGAQFLHLANSAGEPHVHSHVLIANLSRSASSWGAVEPTWFVERAGLAALYQMGLRHHLRRRGWDLDWRLRPDGLADLADTPTEAIRQASSQGRRVRTDGRFAARRAAEATAADLAPSAHPPAPASMGGPPASGATGADQPTARRARLDTVAPLRPGAGSDSPERRPAGSGEAPGVPDQAALARRVELRLAERRSDFRGGDALVALAAASPLGHPVEEALSWVERFCSQMPPAPSPTSGLRWTTPAARRMDDLLFEALAERFAGENAERPPPGGDQWGRHRPEELIDLLTGPGRGVTILGAPPGYSELLGQADILASCLERWAATGRSVTIDTTDEGRLRWEVLTGAAASHPRAAADIVVVDQADRRTSSELLRQSRRAREHLILVEGGTMPRLTNPASHGLVEASAVIGRHFAPHAEPWAVGADPSTGPARSPGRSAAADLLERWDGDGRAAVLVGLGVEEVRALNRAALGEDRPQRGPGRYQPGDRVVVVRGGRRLPGAGAIGTVTETASRSSGSVTVEWTAGRRSVLDLSDQRRVGFGYAATPRLASLGDRPLMVLGPAAAVGRARERVVADRGRPRPAPGPDRGLEASR
ncbi:MAG: relaxase domain-containing protein [Acidobacteriota bacterium]|nr:relaxase domain-containing protein [Acidobacteriota bacterium]